MEKIRLKHPLKNPLALTFVGFIAVVSLVACSSSFLKYDKEDLLQKNDEFSDAVKIDKAETPALPAAQDLAKTEAPVAKGKGKKAKKVATAKKSKKAKEVVAEKAAAPTVRQPDLEDTEGFAPGSRTPLVNPFHVGEVVTHTVKYNFLSITAGELKLKVENYQQVNGRKAYMFATELKTAGMFSSFYSVEDRAETLVDVEDLIPRVFSLHVKESGQLKEARSFFDFDKMHATYWEKKVTKKNGAEEKKQQWDILPFSQNVFSAAYYMRIFKWDVGKEYAFAVADDEKNIMFKGTALRKEVLSTDLGDMKAIVIQPTISVKGVFQQVGDIFIWLSDDDHKYILRIESKIKIGSIVSEVTKIEPGQP